MTYTGNGVCARPRHYQLVPSQFRSGGLFVRDKRGYSGGGEKEKPILVFLLRFFWRMSCWDDIIPKKRKDKLEPLGACHEG